MSLTLKPRHVGRYKDIARLLVKYGRSDVVRDMGLDEAVDDDKTGACATGDQTPPEAIELARDLEKMGPTFIKLGQLLSTRPDLLPPSYTAALARLQDDVEPVPVEQIEETIQRELCMDLRTAFESFDRTPLASASLGQVHAAVLRSGRAVAVKVQRPGIRKQVMDDMEALGEIAEFLDAHTEAGRSYGFADLLDQFRHSLVGELDYRREAANLAAIGRTLERYPRLLVPQPVDDYTTTKVLTMDLVRGRKITRLGPLAQMELDGDVLADQLFRAYLDQILIEGFFHADPHPGNVFVTDDGNLALLDLGMVARLTPGMQDKLVRLLIAVSDGRGQEVAEVAATMGRRLDHFDRDHFNREVTDLVARNVSRSVDEIPAGTVVMELSRISGDSGLRPPPELAMLGKALLNLDQVAHALDPGFQPAEALRQHTGEIMTSRMQPSGTSLLSAALDAKDFAEQLPHRINKLFDSVSSGQFEFKVKAFDETEFLRGVQKLANRVTIGLVIAALIIGAAMTMRVQTDTTILGYPAVSIIAFLAAAIAGAWLVGTIIVNDRAINKRTRRNRRN